MNSAQEVADLVKKWKESGMNPTRMVVNEAEAKLGWPYAWGSTGQLCTTANRKARMENKRISDGDRELIRNRCQVLNGSKTSCDGCAYYPDGQRTRMYDCIGYINSLLSDAGIGHYGAGCTTMWNYAANWTQKGRIADIPETVCLVFQSYPNDASRMQHIGLYVGNGWVFHCSKEVKQQKLSAYPWTHYAILKGLGGDVPVPTPTPTHKTIRKGSTGPDVVECQEDLIKLHYDVGKTGADGKFGAKTEAAVKAFQKASGLNADGIVGPRTWEALIRAAGDTPEPAPTTYYTVTVPHLTLEQAESLVKEYAGASKAEEGGE